MSKIVSIFPFRSASYKAPLQWICGNQTTECLRAFTAILPRVSLLKDRRLPGSALTLILVPYLISGGE